ncbi:hypothetical protein GCM10028868_36780 [Virgibacillus kimchii]
MSFLNITIKLLEKIIICYIYFRKSYKLLNKLDVRIYIIPVENCEFFKISAGFTKSIYKHLNIGRKDYNLYNNVRKG